jgi:hypothetical protein
MVAAACNRSYLIFGPAKWPGADQMPATAPPAGLFRPLVLLAAFVGALVATAGILWGWYGTTVFFEIVRTGWVSCF